MKKLGRRLGKVRFYAGNAVRHALPDRWYRRALPRLLDEARAIGADAFQQRLDYCCRLHEPFALPATAMRLDAIPAKQHTYFYDFRDVARYFPPELRICHRFGDVTDIQPQPTVVKSRPIADDNAANVLLRLNQIRHFRLVAGDRPFAEKRGMAVWRGRCGEHPVRRALVRDWHQHPLCDIGDVAERVRGTPIHREFLSIRDQLAYRYIVSLEGIDVASNTKWIMSSNSLCLMPRPRFETWFMEGALIPDHHYVLLRDDCADLEEKIRYYNAHPAAAEAIVANARAHVAPFRDRRRELLLSLLVLERYFRLSGQW